MKVGIVTQDTLDNFGNKLQNYALQHVLEGYAGEVITIRNAPRPRTPMELLRQSGMAQSPSLCYLLGRRRRAAFLAFHNTHIHDSRGRYCLDAEAPNLKQEDLCDLYCAGSDQVWKPNSRRAGNLHFLPFAEPERTFSYAASFGVNAIPENRREQFAEGLSRIRHISVREDSAMEILRSLTGRTDGEVLIDPTLLLPASHWDTLARCPRQKLPKRYILACFLGDFPEERREALLLQAIKTGCKVLDIMNQRSRFHDIGPAEFLYLVKHAELVCTDSYHGSIFAFLYRRPLAIFRRAGEREDTSGRIETLVSRFSLEPCVAKGETLPVPLPGSDYFSGYAVLEKERKKAKAFLDRVFREAEEAAP